MTAEITALQSFRLLAKLVSTARCSTGPGLRLSAHVGCKAKPGTPEMSNTSCRNPRHTVGQFAELAGCCGQSFQFVLPRWLKRRDNSPNTAKVNNQSFHSRNSGGIPEQSRVPHISTITPPSRSFPLYNNFCFCYITGFTDYTRFYSSNTVRSLINTRLQSSTSLLIPSTTKVS